MKLRFLFGLGMFTAVVPNWCTAGTGELSREVPALVPMAVSGAIDRTERGAPVEIDAGALKGWDHVYESLFKLGVPKDKLKEIFLDQRLPERPPLVFSLTPAEPKDIYHKRNTEAERKEALEFYSAQSYWFRAAERRYAVDRSIILSLLQIETKCGKVTGRSPVFFRLLRLASAASPENIRLNYELQLQKDPQVKLLDVVKRAQFLEKTFLPHAAAAIKIAPQYNAETLTLTGSLAGAIGMPQFLPGNQADYGVDADKDGKIDLFNPADAVFSVANFLHKSGWGPGKQAQQKAILTYNRSQPYLDTAMEMSEALKPSIKQIDSSRASAYSITSKNSKLTVATKPPGPLGKRHAVSIQK